MEKRDIIVSKELLNLFKNSVRIIDKKHLAGIWPVDLQQLRKLKELLPEIFLDKAIMKKYDLAIGYQGKTVKNDLQKLGVDLVDTRIINDIFIHGIPVPWHLLRKAGIDYKKYNFYLTPKQS